MGYLIKPIDMSEETKNKLREQAIRKGIEMTNKKVETEEEKVEREKAEAQAKYDEEERLIEENRQKAPEPPSSVIRWAYRSKINDTVYCMNEDGVIIPAYSGKFTVEINDERKITGVAAQILQDAPPEAEFYTSFSGELSFAPQTREQWGK
ncbi:hypothetical protein LCGC14_2232600 [marine sediment metagenome]|uniref:Uncharacterized protein n=1 Tax=marine sediment metagenome TaxID=412755 RepID=A0A0F9G2W2_9ZZZZ